MCQIYGTENLNAETVLDITDARGHVISLCPPGQCHHFMKWIMESLLLVKIAVTRPSYGISVTEVLIDMWRGIEKRWQRIQSLGALQSGFNRTVPMRNEATVDFTQDCANFANKERRFCLIVSVNQTYTLYICIEQIHPGQPLFKVQPKMGES